MSTLWDIRKALVERRVRLGLSQRDLAARMNRKSTAALSVMEIGEMGRRAACHFRCWRSGLTRSVWRWRSC